MIRGLQITMDGEELSQRIAERIRTHEAAAAALDARIKEREGDRPCDVRAEDGFKTLGDLENDRRRRRDRVTQLTLLRDNLIAGERYVLSKADLRLADLISSDTPDDSDIKPYDAEVGTRETIDGLKLTMGGYEIHRLLDERIRAHQRRAAHWKTEQARATSDSTEAPLPEQMCWNEAERHEWRAASLRFLRDHLEVEAVYRLAEVDLDFGELLPEKPDSLEQDEYEARTGLVFELERLTKDARQAGSAELAIAASQPESNER